MEIKKLKDFINEDFKQTTSEDYYNALKNIMDNDTLEEIISGDNMAENMLAKKLKYLKSEDGNIYIVYGENSDNIIITGLIHKNKKLNISDFKSFSNLHNDIEDILDMFIEKAVNGKKILCSTNDFSEKILKKRIIKKAEDKGYTVKINIFGEHETPDGKIYKNTVLTIKK